MCAEVPIGMGDPEVQSQTDRDERVRSFVEQLSPEEKMLVILKGELYEGNWGSMLEDLRDRLEGLGAQIVPDDETTPQYLGSFVKSEIDKWAAPIKASGVSVD